MPNHVLNDTHIGSISVFLQSDKATAVLNGSKNSSCQFHLSDAITPPADTHMVVGVTSAEIPFTFYNISAKNKSITLMTNTGTPFTVTLAEQNYNVDTLKAALNEACASENVTFTFNENTNKFSIHNDVNGGVRVTATTMRRELGLAPEQLNQALQNTLTANHSCNLAGTSSIYIHFNNMSVQNLDSRGDLNGALAKLNVNCAPGEFIYHDNTDRTEAHYYKISERNLQFFSVSLTDDDNDPLDLNGVDWSVCITIHFKKIRDASFDSRYQVDQSFIALAGDAEGEPPPAQVLQKEKTKN